MNAMVKKQSFVNGEEFLVCCYERNGEKAKFRKWRGIFGVLL